MSNQQVQQQVETRANRDTMKSPERQQKTTAASTKRATVTGIKCSKSRKSPKRVSKQRRKGTDSPPGEKENECCELHFSSAIPPMSPAVPSSTPGQSSQCFQKFKLQLFPIDEVTRKGLEKDKHNPYLELSLGIRKKISSVVKHLDVKWGNSKIASGELMLFPYEVRVENLANYISWSLKDLDTSVADVHAALGRPALFCLRYGWSSKLDLVAKTVTMETKLLMKNRNVCPVVRCGPEPAVGSYNQDGGKPVLLKKSVESQVNQRSGNSSVNLCDLSNISFGALLSEASANANVSMVNCDTFDADIARLKATNQSTSVPQSSIWDAEETCNAFSFRKITSSSKVIPAQLKDAPITSYTKNVSSSLLRLDNQVVDKQVDAYREPMPELQLHTNGVGCTHTPVDSQPDTKNVVSEEPKLQLTTEATHSDSSQFRKLYMNWPDSMGPLEYATPSFKDTVGGDSIGLGALLANSFDAFQNVPIL